MINFAFRLIITIIIFTILKYSEITNLPLLISILFLSDALDCSLSPFQINCKTYDYQLGDKITDLIIYFVFLSMFGNLFNTSIRRMLMEFLIFRLIGVILYGYTNETKYIKAFPDFINSTLIALAISQYTGWNYYTVIIAGMFIKVGFEQIHHHREYLKN